MKTHTSGDEKASFVFRMHERVGGLIQVCVSELPVALPRLSDLHDELAILRELEDLMILRAVPSNPHKALVVDVDAVL
jgi:hypothetical protein